MPSRRCRWPALLVLAILASCAQYGRARMEFDSATGFDLVDGEPERMVPIDDVLRWPWTIRWTEGTGIDWLLAVTTGERPTPKRIDNPADFIRERMVELTGLAIGDFGRMADVSHRLLWVAARDPHALDQIIALQSIERFLAEMDVDPLRVPGASADPFAAAERLDRELTRLDALAPSRRGEKALSDLERRAYLAALRVVSEQPSGTASQGRRTIRTLLRAAVTETDALLLAATRRALADAMSCEMTQTIRVKLASPGAYEVREAALLSLVRLSGPAAVPFSLRVLATAPSDGSRRYDASPSFRRTWVRLCAQLPRDYVFASYAGGPKPIEFLYDTAIADEDEGLRLLALDAMARALGRPLSMERGWADEWWRNYSLGNAVEGGT